MALFGSIFFIPLYVQGVVGSSATSSGLILTPLMLTPVVGSIVSGQLVSRIGRYKWIAILGMLVSVAGVGLLVRLSVNSTNNDVLLAMLVLGLGLGIGMSLYSLIVQNALPTKIGQSTATLTFFRQIGGTIALAAMGSVMTAAYLPAFHSALPVAILHTVPAQFLATFDNPQILLSPATLAQIESHVAALGPQSVAMLHQIIEAVRVGLTQGIHNVFVLSLGLMIVGLVATFFLKEIPLRGGRLPKEEEVEDGDEVERLLAAVM
jgi:MFS family permease